MGKVPRAERAADRARALARSGFAAIVMTMAGGCAATTDRGPWGAGVTWPGVAKLKTAAIDAAAHPQTWAPLIAATALAIDDLDNDLSSHIADRAPVFGSDAASASDTLRDIAKWSYIATGVVTPSATLTHKAKGFAVGVTGAVVTGALTRGAKRATGRQRPDDSDDQSFPSGHTSSASAWATAAAHNVDYIEVPGWARVSIRTAFHGVAAATGWARVEAEVHHASDVLVGYALGHFVARFMQAAFFDPDDPAEVTVTALPEQRGIAIRFETALGRYPTTKLSAD